MRKQRAPTQRTASAARATRATAAAAPAARTWTNAHLQWTRVQMPPAPTRRAASRAAPAMPAFGISAQDAWTFTSVRATTATAASTANAASCRARLSAYATPATLPPGAVLGFTPTSRANPARGATTTTSAAKTTRSAAQIRSASTRTVRMCAGVPSDFWAARAVPATQAKRAGQT